MESRSAALPMSKEALLQASHHTGTRNLGRVGRAPTTALTLNRAVRYRTLACRTKKKGPGFPEPVRLLFALLTALAAVFAAIH